MKERRVGSGGGAVTLRTHVCSTISSFVDRVGKVGMESQLLQYKHISMDTWKTYMELVLWEDWDG